MKIEQASNLKLDKALIYLQKYNNDSNFYKKY